MTTRTRHINLKTAVPGPKSAAILERMSGAVMPGLTITHPVVASRAQGSLITDVDGNTFIDLTGGLGVLNLGHTHEEVIKAAQEQLSHLTHTSFGLVPYESYVSLAERLTARFPGGRPARAVFFNSGAEAVENAVKIARAVTGRSAVVAFHRGFHGRTLMALSLTGKARPYKTAMGPWAPEVYRIPFPYSYRCPMSGTGPHQCDSRCYALIEETLTLQVDPDDVAAIIIEPIQGEGGFVVPPADFLPWLREWTARHHVLLIADEIQTGFGRTGSFFAVEQFGVCPDLLVAGKSIAGGLPLSVVMGDAELLTALKPGQIGGTYGGNPVALASAHAVLNVIEREPVFEQARWQGTVIRERLAVLERESPNVGEVRGLGAMQAVEFVRDRASREPNGPFVVALLKRVREHGVLMAKAGQFGHVVRFLAPLNTPSDILQEALNVFIDAVMAEEAPT
ncbi:MAG: aspartate aminotransferase family protein [Thermaerobacter sp.]|nr:aspartate aminotransferase family protein [Thermaerobacter sp.]